MLPCLILNRRNCVIGVIFFVSICLTPGLVCAKSDLSKTDQIKAGFLLHFTSYVKWPNADKAAVNICIIGHDPFGIFIDRMIDAKPHNRQGQQMILNRLPVGGDVGNCQLIYVTQRSADEAFWRSLPENHKILLVSEYDDFSSEGGIVHFYEQNKRVRIAINLEEARRHQLFISSELLKIVRITSNK